MGTTMKWVLLFGSFCLVSAQTTLTIAATSANKPEGNTGSTPFTFTVTRAGDTTGTSSVNYAVSGTGGLTASDFGAGVFPTGTVNFAVAATTQVITINVVGDTTQENTETFTVTLSNPTGATLGAQITALGTIQNDDTQVTIVATNAALPEGNAGLTAFTFTVTRAGVTTGTSSVEYTVSGTSGINAADFNGALPTGTVNFPVASTTQTVTINVSGDAIFEGNEVFTVTLSNPVGTTIGTANSATGTIQNDDTEIAIAATSANKLEGDSGTTVFTFTVSRNGIVTGQSTVQYAVTPVTGTLNGADFIGGGLPSGTITFAAGASTVVLNIAVAGDTLSETSEIFTVVLSNPTNAVLSASAATATGTIQSETSDGTNAPTVVNQVINTIGGIPSLIGNDDDGSDSGLIGGLVGGIGGGVCLLCICLALLAAFLLMRKKKRNRAMGGRWEPDVEYAPPRGYYQAPSPTPVYAPVEYAVPVEYAPAYSPVMMM